MHTNYINGQEGEFWLDFYLGKAIPDRKRRLSSQIHLVIMNIVKKEQLGLVQHCWLGFNNYKNTMSGPGQE